MDAVSVFWVSKQQSVLSAGRGMPPDSKRSSEVRLMLLIVIGIWGGRPRMAAEVCRTDGGSAEASGLVSNY